MSKKFWIVSLSIAVHIVVFVVAFVTNGWRLDRLDVEKSSISLAVLSPPPAPSGGPVPGEKPKDPTPVKKVVTDPTQPVVPHDEKPAKPAVDDGGGGEGNTKGTGTNPDGEVTDPGTCTGPACGPPTTLPAHEDPPVELPKKKDRIRVPPQILKGLRITGETAIAPPDVVKTQMIRDDHKHSVGAFMLCLSETGDVSSVTIVGSTKYPAYDEKLMTAMRAWKYRPYTVDNTPVPVCSAVSFDYRME